MIWSETSVNTRRSASDFVQMHENAGIKSNWIQKQAKTCKSIQTYAKACKCMQMQKLQCIMIMNMIMIMIM